MEHQISSDLIRGHIDTIILHTLLSGDKFAEQISDTIEKKSDEKYKINQATLYSALKRLENLKLVSSYQKDADIGGRRKFFSLTELGEQTVNANIYNWSHSRAIIDKLINAQVSPSDNENTKHSDNIIVIRQTETIKQPEIQIETAKEPSFSTNTSSGESNKMQNLDNNAVANSEIVEKDGNNVQNYKEEAPEVNFRSILNNLVKNCTSTNEVNPESVEVKDDLDIASAPEIKAKDVVELNADNKNEQIIIEQTNVKKFNQTINENAIPSQKIDISTIDFSDMVIKASAEGYKLRVSAKSVISNIGTLLKNRLNLFTSMIMFLICIIELFVFISIDNNLLGISSQLTLTLLGIFIIWPLLNLIKYKKNPQLTTNKKITGDLILTTGIIVFNLLLITFAANLLLGVDFSIKKEVILYLVIPLTIYADMFIYSIVKYMFSKSNICTTKKTAKK